MMGELAKRRILVVDDEPQVLVALEDLLSTDYLVMRSESGEHALQVVAEEPDIAVVVSDQRMPAMTGNQLFSRLGQISEASRILVTGYSDLGAVINAVNDGRIFAYINKPWDPDSLRITINKAAEHFALQKELASERRLLRDLMDNASDGIYFKDRQLRFQRLNRAFAQSLGTIHANEPEEMIGRKLSEIAPDQLRSPQIEAEERRIIESGLPLEDVIHPVRGPSGITWYSTSRAPIRNIAGSIDGVVGISRDVTERLALDEALRVSEERLQLVIAASSAGLFDWDIRSGSVMYSEGLASLLGERTAALAPTFSELQSRIHPEDEQLVSGAIMRHLREREALRFLECRLLTKAFGYRWYKLSAQAVWNPAGDATRLVGSIYDITDRKEQEERFVRLSRIRAVLGEVNGAIVHLRERDALLRKACEIAVRDGQLTLALVLGRQADEALNIITWDGYDEALISEASEALNNKIVSTMEQAPLLLAGKPVVFNDVTALATAPFGDRLVAGGYRSLALFPLVVAGQLDCVYALASKQSGFFDSQELGLLTGLAANIAFALDHAAKSQRLSFLTSYDELTGLARRELFVDRLQQRLATRQGEAPTLAVLWFDLDRFRQINATLGRGGGDELLKLVAERLSRGVGDDSVARLDSNAFGIISPLLPSESAAIDFLDKLIEPLNAPLQVLGTDLRFTATTGIALCPSDGDSAELLVARAETAAKTAKANGQLYLFYAGSMNQRVAEKLALETKLRRAIENHEFLLHYQPKIELRTGEITGLEALIRWNDPDVGLVPPGAFIPLLEETGLILQVGRWVLREAARQHAAWHQQGLKPPRIAVNVSAIQLAHPEFTASVERTIEEYPLAREGIDLEITESVVMHDMTSNIEKLRLARKAGLKVAVDDFGTGYSSLGYLSRLPVDALKIDRSFIVKMAEDPQDMSIVLTIIALAHSLELRVIAEGVETSNQAQLLRLLKCDEIQGYLVSKPLPAAQIVTMLSTTYSFAQNINIG